VEIPHVVTGEKNSPTAACAGCKMQLKWVPGACGYSWAVLSLEYSGLGLQGGGWASGR